MTVAVIPVKDLEHAKQRMGSLFSPEERRGFARAMLEDVLAAATQAPLERVLVVTRDEEVMALTRAVTAEIFIEPFNQGHTAAVSLAQAELTRQGIDRFLTLPGDVPLVTSDEITTIVQASSTSPCVTLVPSRHGRGTNGVFLAPPAFLRLRFGEPSFANHVSAARSRGIEPTVLWLPGLGLDLDTPEDLQTFMALPSGTRTARFLEDTGITCRAIEPFLAQQH